MFEKKDGMSKAQSIIDAIKKKKQEKPHMALGGMIEEDGEMEPNEADDGFLSAEMQSPFDGHEEDTVESEEDIKQRILQNAMSRIRNAR
jgi:hypothetical protein